jgi:hypothetical protein
MALANFFDKAALSAASILRGADVAVIRDRLLSHVPGLVFDASAAVSREAHHTLELLTDLLARLYPRLAIVPLPSSERDDCDGVARTSTTSLAETLRGRATVINPRIELTSSLEDATVLVVIGMTAPRPVAPSATAALSDGAAEDGGRPQTIYAGSSGWNARLSAHMPVGSGRSENPFGAGTAACLAAAVVFRTVFAAELGLAEPSVSSAGPVPEWTNLSLLELQVSTNAGPVAAPDVSMPTRVEAVRGVDIGESFLVGAGAIGEAVIWALARMPRLEGTLHVVDDEAVELSNLQRYVLTTQESVGQPKVDIASHEFTKAVESSESARKAVAVVPQPTTWGAFLEARDDYTLDRVLLALDSAEDRMAAQASLPRWIANAWTQPDNLGVSRHDFLGEGPCVCCLYFPTGPRKSKDVLYTEALRCTTQAELMEVRLLLYNGRAIGRDFILRAADRLGVPADDLLPFAHLSLDEFYVSALCAGLVLRLGGQIGEGRPAEVPMAFQSALAGILLAAELVTDAAGIRPQALPARTEIDLVRMDFLAPGELRLSSPMAKHPSGLCICQDLAFQDRYRAKYAVGASGTSI